MLQVSWTKKRTNDNILQEINKTKKILNNIKDRRWHMIGHILKYEEKPLYIIIEGKINGKRDLVRSRTSYIKKLISDACLTDYFELKKLSRN